MSSKGDDGAELTQVATLEYEWNLMADRSFLAGHAVWSFTDYATEHRKRYRRHAGLFDAWRRPKMAAELFRARFAEAPFVSLFVTGRDLHVFSNCERIRLEWDDALPVNLVGAPHHIVRLEGAFTRITAEATRSGTTVRNELHAWGEAATVAISIDKSQAKPGRTIAVDLTICDDRGTPVRDWNGHVDVAIDGDGKFFPYTDASEALIARGEGRAYLRLGRSGEKTVIRAVANGLEAGSLRVIPRSN